MIRENFIKMIATSREFVECDLKYVVLKWHKLNYKIGESSSIITAMKEVKDSDSFCNNTSFFCFRVSYANIFFSFHT